jgi:hypothetical protein
MMTYARSRLWVGILSVGTWVLLSITLLFSIERIPESLRSLSLADSILTFIGMYFLISMPFDFLGGYLLPKKYERSKQNLFSFITSYIRGVFYHGSILFLIAFVFLNLLKAFDFSQVLLPLLLTIFFIQILFALFQAQIAKLLANFKESNSSDVLQSYEVWESSDIGFTGGIPFLSKKSIIPKYWIEKFSPDEIQLLLDRRTFLKEKHSHLLGIFGAILFNLCGAAIGYGGCLFTGISLSTHGYLSFLLVWASSVSLWSFIGLLFLPSYSQKATLFGDQSWKKEERTKISHLIENLDTFQDKEPSRQAQIQKIFHPIASVDLRVTALENDQEISKGAWHIARYTLFFSWSILSFMGRAVHCNVGRPNLWVFLPSDG